MKYYSYSRNMDEVGSHWVRPLRQGGFMLGVRFINLPGQREQKQGRQELQGRGRVHDQHVRPLLSA